MVRRRDRDLDALFAAWEQTIRVESIKYLLRRDAEG